MVELSNFSKWLVWCRWESRELEVDKVCSSPLGFPVATSQASSNQGGREHGEN